MYSHGLQINSEVFFLAVAVVLVVLCLPKVPVPAVLRNGQILLDQEGPTGGIGLWGHTLLSERMNVYLLGWTRSAGAGMVTVKPSCEFDFSLGVSHSMLCMNPGEFYHLHAQLQLEPVNSCRHLF